MAQPKQTQKFQVLSALMHNGTRYEPGTEVEMDLEAAKSLISQQVLGDAPVDGKKGKAKE
jgi:hypothetical protein